MLTGCEGRRDVLDALRIGLDLETIRSGMIAPVTEGTDAAMTVEATRRAEYRRELAEGIERLLRLFVGERADGFRLLRVQDPR